jgi:DNA topoisomerase I
VKLRKGFRRATDEERKQLRIPPMYTDAQICNDPKADLQGVAKSPSTGKLLYFYSPEAKHRGQQAKLERVRRLLEDMRALVEVVEGESIAGVPEAMTLRLILKTGMRNGNPSQAVVRKTPSYGASSLLLAHCTTQGTTAVTFSFPGKAGVHHEITVRDEVLARYVWARREVPGAETLFPHTAKDTLKYLRSLDSSLKVHDLRTWFANVLAQAAYRHLKGSAASPAALQKAVAKVVAARLGNTPGAAQKSYIDPALFEEEEA